MVLTLGLVDIVFTQDLSTKRTLREKISNPVEGVHVALWGEGFVRYTWLNPVVYGSKNAKFNPWCKYGTSSASFDHTARGEAYTYASGMFNMTLNSVVAELPIHPDGYSRVYYQCGDSDFGWSPVYSIQIQTAGVSQTQRGNIALIADLGSTNGSDTIAALQQFAESGLIKLVVHAGDISYADNFGKRNHNNSYIWVEYMKQVEKFTSWVPYMTAPGNHESQYDFAAYRNWLPMPYKSSDSETPFWYSFDYMGIHFLSFSTEHSFNQSSAQFAFMRQDLIQANRNRQRVPWIIVFGHRPLYCTSLVAEHRCVYDAPVFRSYLEDLLYEQRVDVYLCGHDHSYERTYPVYRERVIQKDYRNPQAPIYIVDGEAGGYQKKRK